MSPVRSFTDLLVWKKAHVFILEIYRITKTFPREELYGLSSQFRRAGISIAANIAEGFKKKGKLDKIRYYNIAQGSVEECRYYLILSRDLNYCDTSHLLDQVDEISKMLDGYIKSIERDMIGKNRRR